MTSDEVFFFCFGALSMWAALRLLEIFFKR
jgi:hypothetical protein